MPFADALAAANKRLAKAVREREQSQASLASLNVEIPALQRTIAALQGQLNPNNVVKADIDPTMRLALNAKGFSPQVDSLSGMGAIRNGETIEVTEDELLPEPEGTPVVPEE